ncbi:CHASE3 domain-containing protein [Microbispora sp. RL4-1S]|uniref:histidine kinase n=1 Tax=Microbispora oryzae TaxID=2806554 RepID=A0A941ALC5_9ACTN|nr:ATP-binding protein [Microbispora oryzae]MBP2707097.1 CHASE3 domain-containing protein [Microbispora oryzae]
MTGLEPLPPLAADAGRGRLTVGRWFLLAGTAVALVFTVAVAAILIALARTSDARDTLVDVIGPAALNTLQITTALQAQGSAIRAYGLTGDAQYLGAYREGMADEAAAFRTVRALLPRLPRADRVRASLDRLSAATAAWRDGYTERVASAVPTAGKATITPELAAANVSLFTPVRAELATQQALLDELHAYGKAQLHAGWDTLYRAVLLLIGALVIAVAGCAMIVRRAIVGPVARLAGQVRSVASGDFGHEIGVERPAELWELSGHIDGMRRRIMAEWESASQARQRLAEQAEELSRSNAELEQFAYVASHDLQEPLRKVASFTQMLEQRYGDRLDDRAKQYIAYAVDGARRMQALINDLLDLSRVGRVGGDRVPMDSGEALTGALRVLDTLVAETGAEITHDPLPRVVGNAGLLTQVFQNLIGNALKFRSEEPPRVHIGARRDGDMWEFSCADNGIGVDPRYAERIFLIFQRLHPRDVYPGTGIGLSLCRKIIDYHGGRIWLDADARPGSTFRWTLPPAGDSDA